MYWDGWPGYTLSLHLNCNTLTFRDVMQCFLQLNHRVFFYLSPECQPHMLHCPSGLSMSETSRDFCSFPMHMVSQPPSCVWTAYVQDSGRPSRRVQHFLFFSRAMGGLRAGSFLCCVCGPKGGRCSQKAAY